jgi:hypothetical protein
VKSRFLFVIININNCICHVFQKLLRTICVSSGQAAGFDGPGGLQHHRDGPAKGSDAYRRAGGEPEVFPTGPTVFRMAV